MPRKYPKGTPVYIRVWQQDNGLFGAKITTSNPSWSWKEVILDTFEGKTMKSAEKVAILHCRKREWQIRRITSLAETLFS